MSCRKYSTSATHRFSLLFLFSFFIKEIMNRTFYDAAEQLIEAPIVIQRDMYGFFSYLRDRAYLYFIKSIIKYYRWINNHQSIWEAWLPPEAETLVSRRYTRDRAIQNLQGIALSRHLRTVRDQLVWHNLVRSFITFTFDSDQKFLLKFYT